MKNRFVAFDVETANADMASICQIGVVTFEGTEVVNSWGTLIDPQDFFDPRNVSIHGIDEAKVQGSPSFPDVSVRLREAFAGNVVATHTHFDRVSVARVCSKYDLPAVETAWIDTARVVRRAWPQFRQSGYNLANVTSFLGIEFEHHDAEEDARAAGLVLNRAIAESELSLEEWVVRASTPTSGTVKRTGNPDGPLAGEVVVFTGTLSIPREEAADLAANAGCSVATGVGKKVTLVVVGEQDIRSLGGHQKSSKHRKAERMIQDGQPIRIIQEFDFRALVSA
jgi:DNA polymerase-3 subunit epsilon